MHVLELGIIFSGGTHIYYIAVSDVCFVKVSLIYHEVLIYTGKVSKIPYNRITTPGQPLS